MIDALMGYGTQKMTCKEVRSIHHTKDLPMESDGHIL